MRSGMNVLGMEVHSEREALANLLDALDIAENAARQLALATDNAHWVIVAGKLGETRSTLSKMAQRTLLTR